MRCAQEILCSVNRKCKGCEQKSSVFETCGQRIQHNYIKNTLIVTLAMWEHFISSTVFHSADVLNRLGFSGSKQFQFSGLKVKIWAFAKFAKYYEVFAPIQCVISNCNIVFFKPRKTKLRHATSVVY